MYFKNSYLQRKEFKPLCDLSLHNPGNLRMEKHFCNNFSQTKLKTEHNGASFIKLNYESNVSKRLLCFIYLLKPLRLSICIELSSFLFFCFFFYLFTAKNTQITQIMFFFFSKKSLLTNAGFALSWMRLIFEFFSSKA